MLACRFRHHSVPYLPDIEGQESFPGEILHSHDYRCPLKYENQTVIVLGTGPSGQDISADLSPHAAKVARISVFLNA